MHISGPYLALGGEKLNFIKIGRGCFSAMEPPNRNILVCKSTYLYDNVQGEERISPKLVITKNVSAVLDYLF